MYSFESRIRYSEVDLGQQITLSAIVDYFQDCSSFQSEDLNVGVDFLKEKQEAWILSSWQIEIKRYPMFGEKVIISTWPYGMKGFYGYRNYTIDDEKGEHLAVANSIWVMMDLKNARPKKVPQEFIDAYKMSPQLPMETVSRKISLPEGMTAQTSFPVHKYHIDTNQHVNNGKYISMAQEYLPKEFKVGKMRAEYRKAAVYGDIIYPFTIQQGGKMFVNLADEEGKPYAIAEFE